MSERTPDRCGASGGSFRTAGRLDIISRKFVVCCPHCPTEVNLVPNLLIRDVPESLHIRIRREQKRRMISQNDCLLQLLTSAVDRLKGPSLFDDEVSEVAGSAPVPETGQGTYDVPFTFIDLFAGIGGLRLGLESVGGDCVFSCEKDPFAQKTYHAWYGENPEGDVTTLAASGEIPQHDVLAAGFPCQPFSIAGVSKKKSLGREHGFKDKTQGTLFFHLAEIIEKHRPPVLLLENVKNLRSHNRGDTWQTISGTLSQLGYCVFDKVIDAVHYVPQHRERVLIVGFDRDVFGDDPPFTFPEPPDGPLLRIRDLLEDSPDPRYTLTDHLWQYLQDYAEKHRQKGNGFGCSVVDLDGTTRTLSARYYKDGSEILVSRGARKRPRRLTPRECARLMGFPDDFVIPVSDTQAYKQFGNSVIMPVMQEVARVMKPRILKLIDPELARQKSLLAA
ncbi:MAG: DNA (cytosine-5-)-methyltransferase [Planctomycetaceae bacterium]|nr:DNA (cytosine-5-)-methyltransferase [Planctomycetaceae bacterium]